jgi:purine-binding chemotaxis protein CheW
MDVPGDRNRAEGEAGSVLPPSAPGASESPDLLDEFFFRPDESGPAIPDFGPLAVAAAARPDEDRKQYLGFLLDGSEYAIDIEQVREIVRPPPITEVPRAPPHILGVVTVRGEVIAILDPRQRLRLPRASITPSARIVICDAGDGPSGLLVDGVSQVVRLPANAIEPRPQAMNGSGAEYLSGIGRDRGRFFMLLDVRALFASDPVGQGARPTAPEAR